MGKDYKASMRHLVARYETGQSRLTDITARQTLGDCCLHSCPVAGRCELGFNK